MVAPGIAKIHFAVLDDRVVPVSDVDGAVGTHLYVHGPERRVRGLDQLGSLLGSVTGTVLADHEATSAMAAEVVGDHVALPVVGEVAAAQDFQSAVLGAAGVEPRQEARRLVGK